MVPTKERNGFKTACPGKRLDRNSIESFRRTIKRRMKQKEKTKEGAIDRSVFDTFMKKSKTNVNTLSGYEQTYGSTVKE